MSEIYYQSGRRRLQGGPALKQMREDRDKTLRQLAADISAQCPETPVGFTTLCMCEKMIHVPVETALVLARFFGVRPGVLNPAKMADVIFE